jgi:uncharacterized membrane protein YgcG
MNIFCRGPRVAIRFVVLALVLGGGLLRAVEYPTATGYVNDFAGVLQPSTKQEIELAAMQLEANTSMELAVVTVKSVAPLQLKDYAVELFRRWKIGKKGKNNGVLFIVAVQDRRVEIEVGYGLEHVLTDSKCGQLLDRAVVPYFKKGDWNGGISSGAQAIIATLTGKEVSLGERTTSPENPSAESFEYGDLDLLWTMLGVGSSTGVFVGGVIVLVILFIWAVSFFFRPPCPRCKQKKHVRQMGRDILVRPTYKHGGSEIIHYRCKACQYDWSTRQALARLERESSRSYGSSGGGSSFSGFGGGSSGGGGAGRSF